LSRHIHTPWHVNVFKSVARENSKTHLTDSGPGRISSAPRAAPPRALEAAAGQRNSLGLPLRPEQLG
jgi:hypothetical protein